MSTPHQLFHNLCEAFAGRVAVGTPTPKQKSCLEEAARIAPTLENRPQRCRRERRLQDLAACIAGHCDGDECLLLEQDVFTKERFYSVYSEQLSTFRDKFDFLIWCVSRGVCRVRGGFEERFLTTLREALEEPLHCSRTAPVLSTQGPAPVAGLAVLETELVDLYAEEQAAKDAEQRRVEKAYEAPLDIQMFLAEDPMAVLHSYESMMPPPAVLPLSDETMVPPVQWGTPLSSPRKGLPPGLTGCHIKELRKGDSVLRVDVSDEFYGAVHEGLSTYAKEHFLTKHMGRWRNI